MDPPADWPITGVCIVSDPNRAPPNYTVVSKNRYMPNIKKHVMTWVLFKSRQKIAFAYN